GLSGAGAGGAPRGGHPRRGGGAGPRCTLTRPPACADTAADDVTALVYGAENPTGVDGGALHDQLRCQAAIGRASARFVQLRLNERANGDRAERASRMAFQMLFARCGVGVGSDPGGTGLSVPLLGAPCAGRVASGGSGVDTTELVACLRPSLERILDQVAPTHLRPNVILINTDDQRWDSTWVMPTIEEMASKG